jgi:hypothetical protein
VCAKLRAHAALKKISSNPLVCFYFYCFCVRETEGARSAQKNFIKSAGVFFFFCVRETEGARSAQKISSNPLVCFICCVGLRV